jgi:hypothetical protein
MQYFYYRRTFGSSSAETPDHQYGLLPSSFLQAQQQGKPPMTPCDS